jgi:hypothetical protein
MRRICLVTPGHLGSNPRIVKEANALSAAGFKTHVVFADSYPAARVRDAAILRSATWTHEVICQTSAAKRISSVVRKAALAVYRCGLHYDPVCELAHHSFVHALTQTVCQFPADLYIGHCLAALPAVVKAARKHGALSGFDAEDYHIAEQEDEGIGRVHNAIAQQIEDHYLPFVNHFTAASPLIAREYQKRFGKQPTTILNVFPLCDAPATPAVAEPSAVPSFYWFSQTVGPSRGLEAILAIARNMQRPMRFDFRGHCRPEYQQQLQQLVAGTLIELRILPPENPDRMVALAAGYTAGLALEQSRPLNRDLCLTNKAFTYLLAGTPVIFSPTSAQVQLAGELGAAAMVLDLADSSTSPAVLSEWLDSERPGVAAKAAWKLGQEKCNWDSESQVFLSTVQNVLS